MHMFRGGVMNFFCLLLLFIGSSLNFEVFSMNKIRSPYQYARNLVLADVNDCVIVHFCEDKLPEDKEKNVELPYSLKDIRSRITQNRKNRQQIFGLIQTNYIKEEVRGILEPKKEYVSDLAAVFYKPYPDDDLWKFSLLSSVSLPWKELISTFRRLYPDNVFHDYSFEDAVFIMFLCPEDPGWIYKNFYSERYQTELKFYMNCLAGAIKKWMEKVTDSEIQISGWNMKGSAIAENICYSYWTLFGKDGSPLK